MLRSWANALYSENNGFRADSNFSCSSPAHFGHRLVSRQFAFALAAAHQSLLAGQKEREGMNYGKDRFKEKVEWFMIFPEYKEKLYLPAVSLTDCYAPLTDLLTKYIYYTEIILRKYMYLFFSPSSQRSGILNPSILLANCARSSGPYFPIRTPSYGPLRNIQLKKRFKLFVTA